MSKQVNMRWWLLFLCTVFGLSLFNAPAAVAQPYPGQEEEEEKKDDGPYAELLDVEPTDGTKPVDRTTPLLVQRYRNLIRLQEWSDASNTAKVMARYVEHDPELEWVKLAVVKGSGKTRTVKEGTLPVAKLSKTCQSRVRQIALLQKKLDELAAKDTDAAGNPVAADDPGAPMSDEVGVDPNQLADVGGAVEQPPAEAPGANEPDPLGFEEAAASMPAPAGPSPSGP